MTHTEEREREKETCREEGGRADQEGVSCACESLVPDFHATRNGVLHAFEQSNQEEQLPVQASNYATAHAPPIAPIIILFHGVAARAALTTTPGNPGGKNYVGSAALDETARTSASPSNPRRNASYKGARRNILGIAYSKNHAIRPPLQMRHSRLCGGGQTA